MGHISEENQCARAGHSGEQEQYLLAQSGNPPLWAVKIFKCQMATNVFEGYVYTDRYSGTSNVLICRAIAPGLQCAAEVLWCCTTAEEENNALALQKLQANVRQNSTGGSRQGNK